MDKLNIGEHLGLSSYTILDLKADDSRLVFVEDPTSTGVLTVFKAPPAAIRTYTDPNGKLHVQVIFASAGK